MAHAHHHVGAAAAVEIDAADAGAGVVLAEAVKQGATGRRSPLHRAHPGAAAPQGRAVDPGAEAAGGYLGEGGCGGGQQKGEGTGRSQADRAQAVAAPWWGIG